MLSDFIFDHGSTGAYGPEWDPAYNTPQANGGDNPWAGDPYGPEWDADYNTPQDNGGNNPWAPGYYDSVWY